MAEITTWAGKEICNKRKKKKNLKIQVVYGPGGICLSQSSRRLSFSGHKIEDGPRIQTKWGIRPENPTLTTSPWWVKIEIWKKFCSLKRMDRSYLS